MRFFTSNEIIGGNYPSSQIGGKAFYLAQLLKNKFPVPDFLVIPCSTVDQLLEPVNVAVVQLSRGLSESSDAALQETALAIQQCIRSVSLPESFARELQDACCQQFGTGYLLAVRSSAAAEDGASTSFAGQHDTALYVQEGDLAEQIKSVIASGWNAGALKYRLLHQLPMERIQFAVLLQQMVAAEKSGICFSMNLKGNMADMVMVAGYGLGEGIVSDRVETDTYWVNRQSKFIEKKVVPKLTALRYQPQSGVVPIPVAETLQAQPALRDAEIMQVFGQTIAAEALLRSPADTEFSIDHTGKLYILQMRPITTAGTGAIKILDNTNIVESYPGLTLPLSFSFAAQAYQNVFSGSSEVFMMPAKTVRALQGVFEHLLAHAYGRVYYRLDNWYRMMARVYPSRRAMQAWEKAVGLVDGESAKMQFPLGRKIRTFLALAKIVAGYKSGNRRFFRLFYQNYAALRRYEDHLASPSALWAHYERTTSAMFRPWYLTLVNDFLAFKCFGWLQDLIQYFRIGDQEELANDLLCGIGGVDSEEAVIAVLRLKEAIAGDKALSKLFLQPPEAIAQAVTDEAYRPFYDQVNAYLEQYGDRTLAELKLETKSLRRHPELFFRLLKNQLSTAITAAGFREKQVQIRNAAEAKVAQKFPWWRSGSWLLNTVLHFARYGLKNRENMRLCRTRAYGAVKDIFLEIGKMMANDGIIAVPEDVFYLTINDLKDYCANGNRDDKMAFVTRMKTQYAAWAHLHLPDRIMYTGDTLPVFAAASSQSQSQEQRYSGIAVSQGRVVAEAIVITEPELDTPVKGKILITKMTDPGWIFLMAQAAGLVSEKGSLLSHTAIVGRELGIPVVVGIPGVTTFFKSGDMVGLDGDAGVVWRVG